MNIFEEYLKELTTIEPMDFLVVGVFSIFMSIYLYKNYKKNQEVEFFEITNIDNDAYWIYNNKVYHAKTNDGTIDKKTIKEIKGFNMPAKDMHSMIIEMDR